MSALPVRLEPSAQATEPCESCGSTEHGCTSDGYVLTCRAPKRQRKCPSGAECDRANDAFSTFTLLHMREVLARPVAVAAPAPAGRKGVAQAPTGGETARRRENPASGARTGVFSPAVPVSSPPRPAIEGFKPFPVGALPPAVRTFVQAVAAATGTDASYPALAALVTLAGAIGNRCCAIVKEGWREPSVLWGAIVGRSGCMKSPVLRAVTEPVHALFRAARDDHHEAMNGYALDMERHAAEVARWRQAQRKGAAGDPPLAPVPPKLKRLIVCDTTAEALSVLLADNPTGLLVARDELAGWVGAFDRYSGGRGADQAFWLSCYDAATLTVDRKGGDGSVHVDRGAVSVLGGIQPGTLARLFGRAEREAGLLGRLLLVHPPEMPGKWTDAELLPDVIDA